MPHQTSTLTVPVTIAAPIYVTDNIQSDNDWVPNIGPSINKIQADHILGYTPGINPTDPLVFVNSSSQEGGGGLISHDYPLTVSTDGSPFYFGMDIRFHISSAMWKSIMRLELDCKILVDKAAGITPIPAYELNGSMQYNPTTQAWQYDPDGKGWQNTGFTSQMLLDAINEVRFRWQWNGKKDSTGLWGLTSIQHNTKSLTFSKTYPLLAEAWGGPIFHPQIQTELTGAPGMHAFEAARHRLLSSPQPIPLTLAWS